MPVVGHVKVVDYPVMAQFVQQTTEISSCSLLLRCSMSLLCRSSRFVRSRGRRSRSHSCSSISLGQVVARPLCAATDVLGRCPSQFIDSCVRRAPDSGDREFGGHSSSQQRQVLDFQQWSYGGDDGFFNAFCVIFRAPPVSWS